MKRFNGIDVLAHEGEIFVALHDAAGMVAAACQDIWDKHLEFNAERQAKHDAEMAELRASYQEKHRLWQEAEQRAGKLDRAEEAMREYEKTIGEQARELAALRQRVAAGTLPKRKPRSDKL